MSTNKRISDKKIFSKEILWESYLKVESEMAQAQSEAGIIPEWASKIIAKNSKLEIVGIKNIEKTFNINKSLILSIVNELSKKCGEAGAFVHWGGTTRNIIETGNNLVIREAHRELMKELSLSLKIMSELSYKYSKTAMVARTFGQNALPITFGFKVAGWIESFVRLNNKFKNSENNIFSLFFGGAVGGMHGFGEKGHNFIEILSKRLGFKNVVVPNRISTDQYIDYLSTISIQGIVIGQISQELYLLMSESINEISEKQSKGQIGSSTMPHKVNPQLVLEVIRLSFQLKEKATSVFNITPLFHEGGEPNNQIIETILFETIPMSMNLFNKFNNLLNNIKVNDSRMKDNLYLSKDFIASENLMLKLAVHIGRPKSHDIIHNCIQVALKNKSSVKNEFLNNKVILQYIPEKNIDELLDPINYLGQCEVISKNANVLALETITKIQERIIKKDLDINSIN